MNLMSARVHESNHLHEAPVILVINDDAERREFLEAIVLDAGWRARVFSCAQEFLSYPRTAAPTCLLLDVTLPDLNGLDLQQRVLAEWSDLSIIFITRHGTVPMAVQAMKAGAVEFLTEPFCNEALLSAMRHGIERSRTSIHQEARARLLRGRYATLSPRERQVMALVTRGRLNKQVGGELGISEITVKAHRGVAMRKMLADSLADLVNMAATLSLGRFDQRTADLVVSWRGVIEAEKSS